MNSYNVRFKVLRKEIRYNPKGNYRYFTYFPFEHRDIWLEAENDDSIYNVINMYVEKFNKNNIFKLDFDRIVGSVYGKSLKEVDKEGRLYNE